MNLKSSNKADVNMTELVVEIDAESFEKAVEAAYQRQKKNISMPGFRKGKVPRKMCERTYGENVFYEDAINALLNMELPALIVDNKLNVVDTPKVEVTAVSKEDGVTMKVICVTKPEISLEGYKGIEAPKVVKEIADEDVDQQIESMRQRNARVVSVDDRAAEMGDEVNLNFEGFFGDEAFDGGKGENYQLKLGSGQFIPGFGEKVAGHNIGENFDVTVTFPEDYQMDEYAGKEAVFHCLVHEIKEEQLPELDDEFAKDVSEHDTLEELKQATKERLETYAKSSAENQMKDAAILKVVEANEVEIPRAMVDDEIDRMANELDQQLRYQGMGLNQYLQFVGKDAAAFREERRPEAEKAVKTRIVLMGIVNAENITVTDEEREEELKRMAAQYQMEVDKLKEIIGEDNLGFLTKDLQVKKAIDFIYDNAKVK